MPARIEWNEGEVAMHQQLKVPIGHNPTSPGFPERYAVRIMHSPLVAVGALDAQGRPWTTIWGGERGFARRVAENVLAMNITVDRLHDPVFKAIWGSASTEEGAVVRDERVMSGLAIDVETRDRVKLAGNMIAGAVGGDGEVQLAMYVRESLGNCPKYLNKKAIRPHAVEGAELINGDELKLGTEALGVLERADLFFLSSTDGRSMDTNHRGGAPGFVRVMRNEDGEVTLVYPEYSGNRLYQSLGNLRVNPLVGMVIPDFSTGDALYVTGSASILVGEEASSLIKRSNLAVKIDVTEIRHVKAGLPFRGDIIDYSPYNPPVRHLSTEQTTSLSTEAGSDLTATLMNREPLTPNINRFTFDISSASGKTVTWEAGQHITFDFSDELDNGYSHMRDDDPQSLNDDFVRTFTVSNRPTTNGRVEITAKRHGPATGLLWRQNLRAPLEIPVMGFGGEESFRLSATRENAFIAGGVGITPLLAQAVGVPDDKLKLLWSMRAEDVPLAIDSFERIPGLAQKTKLFITGDEKIAKDRLDKVKEMGGEFELRRMEARDIGEMKDQGRKFYLCAAPKLLGKLNEWLEGEDVIWEDFNY